MPKQVVNNERPASQQRSDSPPGATMKEKLFPSALLSNTERNELHQQIYTYFAWLNENMVTAANSGQRAKANNIGLDITGIKNILTSIEEGLGDKIPTLKKVAEDHLKSRKAPSFEHGCISELKRRADSDFESRISRKHVVDFKWINEGVIEDLDAREEDKKLIRLTKKGAGQGQPIVLEC